MPLTENFQTYLHFGILLSPIILPAFAILASVYEQDLKGFIYILGVLMAMTVGRWFSTVLKAKLGDGLMVPAAACNLTQRAVGAGGWGTVYGSPGPDALFLAFTLTYLALPMFTNGNVNFLALGALWLIMLLSAIFRVGAPLYCSTWAFVVAGWVTGFILGSLWFFFVDWVNTSYPDSNLTYFGPIKSDKQTCVLDKKAFRCKTSSPAD